MNDQLGAFFSTHRGVRQGDHMSSTLFNPSIESMSVMIRKLKN
jgi:hypothetical protein